MKAVRMFLLCLHHRAMPRLRLGFITTAHRPRRFHPRLCHSTSSTGPPMELSKLHYPSGSGSRKYRTEQQAGQMSLFQINRLLKVKVTTSPCLTVSFSRSLSLSLTLRLSLHVFLSFSALPRISLKHAPYAKTEVSVGNEYC